ncbi:alpha-2,8-sialyltransferase 8F isoform X3 [Melanerpes formicivorus]|uniref:alpha-2,8-sialyltransferase 8F isoform X3 n=1 Tax=Melanerpes formicivorus TaxID=211600 RepID=UPI00358F4323
MLWGGCSCGGCCGARHAGCHCLGRGAGQPAVRRLPPAPGRPAAPPRQGLGGGRRSCRCHAESGAVPQVPRDAAASHREQVFRRLLPAHSHQTAELHLDEETRRIYKVQSSPLSVHPFKTCAVVGNGGILKNSSCGAEIDRSDFVFRCNLPPTTGSISKDVGNKTSLVTVNPSIIAQKYNKLNEKKTDFLENIAVYGDAFLLLPAFSFRSNTATSFKVYHTLQEFKAAQRAIFFHPTYLKSLAQFWRTKGVKAYRLSSGFMITSAALELCEDVKLYGFWPFSKSTEKMPISHHYYDNQLPKPGFHAMPKEYNQILQLHGKGILKLQIGKCESD